MNAPQTASMQRRLKRWDDRNSLWLVQLLAMLQAMCGDRPGRVRDWLNMRVEQIASALKHIIFCHAALRVQRMQSFQRAPRGFIDPRAPRQTCTPRKVIGAHLRQSFKAKTILGRIEKIRAATADRKKLIARLARRLRKGLTRMLSAHSRVLPGASCFVAALRWFSRREGGIALCALLNRPDTS